MSRTPIKKRRQRLDFGWSVSPAARNTDASITSRLDGGLLTLHLALCLSRVQIGLLGSQLHVVKILRPITKRARAVQVGTSYGCIAVAIPLEPVKLDQVRRNIFLCHECLYPE